MIMTTEPKFIPKEAANVKLFGENEVKIRLIDCVGYIVKGAEGLYEEQNERMVMTPWSESPMPFTQAADCGSSSTARCLSCSCSISGKTNNSIKRLIKVDLPVRTGPQIPR